ncbi:MAG: hypothetical protein M0C28_11270 [Candidatus Moduliflexus flocculans]|nr:hypothetical protein [Candidatus Moduliflexus flocculans]
MADDGCAVDDPAAGGRVYEVAGGVGELRTELRPSGPLRRVVRPEPRGGRPRRRRFGGADRPDEDRVWAYDPRSGVLHARVAVAGVVPARTGRRHGGGPRRRRRRRAGAGQQQLLALAGDEPPTARAGGGGQGPLVRRWEQRVPADAGRHRHLDAGRGRAGRRAGPGGGRDVDGGRRRIRLAIRVFRGLGAGGAPERLARVARADRAGHGGPRRGRRGGDRAPGPGPRAGGRATAGLSWRACAWTASPSGCGRRRRQWFRCCPTRRARGSPDRTAGRAGGADGAARSGETSTRRCWRRATRTATACPTRWCCSTARRGSTSPRPREPAPPAYPARRPSPAPAAAGGEVLAVASDDGRVALFDAALTLLDDGNGDGLPDVEVADALPAPPVIVRIAGNVATLAVDAGSRPAAFPAPLRAGPDGLIDPTARSAAPGRGDERAVVAAARCDCPAGSVPVAFAARRGPGGAGAARRPRPAPDTCPARPPRHAAR